MKVKESIVEFAEEITNKGVKIDILINNAGVCRADELFKELPSSL
jgi:short-subunit dehydrogenase involved in D-alanine esterification of teichoic acids